MVRIGSVSAIVAVSLAVAGCTTLRVDDWRVTAQDWVTEGGSPERAHLAHAEVAPPLEVVWRANVDALPAGAGVAVAGEYAVVATRRGDLIVLDLTSGSRVGRARLGRALAGAPLLAGDLAIVSVAAGDNSLVAYSLRDGRTRWSRQGGALESSPVRAGSAVVAASTDGTVAAYELNDGSPRWEVRPDSIAGFVASPAVANARVIVADDRGAVRALEAGTGSVIWQVDLPGPVHETPARAGDLIVASTTRGSVCALRLLDGSIEWCHHSDEAHVRFTSPAVVGERVLVGGSDGLLRALEAGTGAPIWTFRGPAALAAAPLIAGGFVYLGSLDGRLLAVDLRSGELVWSGEAPGRVHAPVAPAADGILVLSAPRHVTAFRPAALRASE